MAIHYPETGHDACAAVEDTSFWFAHRNEVLVSLMRRFPPGQPLYDVGGGNGVVAAALVRSGIKAIVVEPGAAGAARARERGLESINATFDTAGLKAGSVPAIGMFDVLEHIEDSLGFLRQAHALLKPGASLYVAVPAYEWLWSGEDDFAQHFRRYTARTLTDELSVAGFEVEYTTYMFAFLVFPIWLMRRVPYRLGLARPFSPGGVEADHSGRGAGFILPFFRDLELLTLRSVGRIPFGTSVLAVATKR